MIRTMIDQLGGQRIFAMAFEGFVYSTADTDNNGEHPPGKGPAGISLSIAHGLRRMVKATHVVIELEDDDTYTVELHRVSAKYQTGSDKLRETFRVYADQLRSVVEGMTGGSPSAVQSRSRTS